MRLSWPEGSAHDIMFTPYTAIYYSSKTAVKILLSLIKPGHPMFNILEVAVSQHASLSDFSLKLTEFYLLEKRIESEPVVRSLTMFEKYEKLYVTTANEKRIIEKESGVVSSIIYLNIVSTPAFVF